MQWIFTSNYMKMMTPLHQKVGCEWLLHMYMYMYSIHVGHGNVSVLFKRNGNGTER